MKVIMTVMLMVLIHQVSLSQIKWEQGRMRFVQVVEVPGASKKSLYLQAKLWFTNTFKSANAVIQLDDAEAGTIVGKGIATIYITILGHTNEVLMPLTIRIDVKDGKFRYQFYDIMYSQEDGDVPCERYIAKENMYRKNGKAKVMPKKYEFATLNKLSSLKESLESGMKISTGDTSDDW